MKETINMKTLLQELIEDNSVSEAMYSGNSCLGIVVICYNLEDMN